MINNKSILVTGANGFIGRWLCRELVNCGNKLITITQKNIKAQRGIKNIKADISDYESIRSVNEKVDFCIHLAAISSIEECESNPAKAFNVNVLGTLNVLRLCKNLGVTGVLIASSGKVYGDQEDEILSEGMILNPSDVYEKTKACCDYISQGFGNRHTIPVIMTRLGNVYGPDDSDTKRLVPHTILSILNKRQPIIYGDKYRKRNFIYVKDVVNFYILALELLDNRKISGGVFNVANGENYSIIDVVNSIIEISGIKIKPKYIKTVNKKSDNVLSIEKAKSNGWKPKYSLESGLKETFEWYKANRLS